MALAAERLENLAQRGDAAVLALWAEASGDLNPLARAADRHNPLTRLQRVFLLRSDGQIHAAKAELDAVPVGLPHGLAGYRDELLAELASAGVEQPTIQPGEMAESSGMLAAGSPHEDAEGDAPAAASLATWLIRVQGWRETLGV